MMALNDDQKRRNEKKAVEWGAVWRRQLGRKDSPTRFDGVQFQTTIPHSGQPESVVIASSDGRSAHIVTIPDSKRYHVQGTDRLVFPPDGWEALEMITHTKAFIGASEHEGYKTITARILADGLGAGYGQLVCIQGGAPDIVALRLEYASKKLSASCTMQAQRIADLLSRYAESGDALNYIHHAKLLGLSETAPDAPDNAAFCIMRMRSALAPLRTKTAQGTPVRLRFFAQGMPAIVGDYELRDIGHSFIIAACLPNRKG